MKDFEKLDNRVFGFLVVGFLSLIGGIFIFAFIVVPQRRPESGVPRDVQLIFTQVYSQQGMLRSEHGRYSAALVQVGVDQENCRRYQCLLTLAQDGQDYTFRLSKGGKSWEIQSKSPMPKEIGNPERKKE